MPENQRLFRQAARRAGERAGSVPKLRRGRIGSAAGPDDLADMVARADRGEPPLSRSESGEAFPRRVGVSDQVGSEPN